MSQRNDADEDVEDEDDEDEALFGADLLGADEDGGVAKALMKIQPDMLLGREVRTYVLENARRAVEQIIHRNWASSKLLFLES